MLLTKAVPPCTRPSGIPDDATRSRLLAFWDQEGEGGHSSWAPAPAGYGRVLAGEALQAQLTEDALAERRAYEALGMKSLLAKASSGEVDHATHVLDTLAGLPDGRAASAAAKPLLADDACKAPLVLVSVPAPPAGHSGAAAAMAQVLDALHFIRGVARRVAPNAAVVVNLSMGVQAGPRNGGLLVERAIDELMLADSRLLVIMAAGNAAAQPQAAGGELSDEAEIGWRIRPQDGTDSHLELAWWGDARGLKLQLQAPHGLPLSPWVGVGEQAGLQDAQGRWLGLIQMMPSGRALVTLSPSLSQPARGQCPAGCWRMRIQGGSGLAVAAVIQGDPWQAGQFSSPQSYLEFARGLTLVHSGLPNAIASGDFPLVVGAARMREATAAPYTPELDQAQMHWLAAADESAFAQGLVAAGALSGQWARMGGSSVASPVAARHWVNLIALHGAPHHASQWRQFGLRPPSAGGLRRVSHTEGAPAVAGRRGMLRPGPLALEPLRGDMAA